MADKLAKAEWAEYRLGDLFEVKAYKKRFDANKVQVLDTGEFPYVVRMGGSNGVKGYINEDPAFLNEGNTISFGQDTATMFYQKKPYFTGDKIKILHSKDSRFSQSSAPFFIAMMSRSFSNFSWGSSSFSEKIITKQILSLPTKNGEIDFEFMENFVAELEAQRVAELEAHLTVSGLKNYALTPEEEQAIANLDNVEWQVFNLEKLFGKSTRGRRLKSDDRIPGDLPFVTAGEAETGVSAFIGNNVAVFSKNTTTIDMFGSAKYRNYDYGCDDHVAVVHTENLNKLASIFVTSAIHKASYTDKFSYSRNFYAKDANELNISLPAKNNQPDFELMETLISAVQKIVIKDVVLYADEKIAATKKIITKSGKIGEA